MYNDVVALQLFNDLWCRAGDFAHVVHVVRAVHAAHVVRAVHAAHVMFMSCSCRAGGEDVQHLPHGLLIAATMIDSFALIDWAIGSKLLLRRNWHNIYIYIYERRSVPPPPPWLRGGSPAPLWKCGLTPASLVEKIVWLPCRPPCGHPHCLPRRK